MCTESEWTTGSLDTDHPPAGPRPHSPQQDRYPYKPSRLRTSHPFSLFSPLRRQRLIFPRLPTGRVGAVTAQQHRPQTGKPPNGLTPVTLPASWR